MRTYGPRTRSTTAVIKNTANESSRKIDTSSPVLQIEVPVNTSLRKSRNSRSGNISISPTEALETCSPVKKANPAQPHTIYFTRDLILLNLVTALGTKTVVRPTLALVKKPTEQCLLL
jgi:hypothetical protein